MLVGRLAVLSVPLGCSGTRTARAVLSAPSGRHGNNDICIADINANTFNNNDIIIIHNTVSILIVRVAMTSLSHQSPPIEAGAATADGAPKVADGIRRNPRPQSKHLVYRCF